MKFNDTFNKMMDNILQEDHRKVEFTKTVDENGREVLTFTKDRPGNEIKLYNNAALGLPSPTLLDDDEKFLKNIRRRWRWGKKRWEKIMSNKSAEEAWDWWLKNASTAYYVVGDDRVWQSYFKDEAEEYANLTKKKIVKKYSITSTHPKI